MSTRKRKNHFVYKRHTNRVKQKSVCQFCEFDASQSQIVSEHQRFWVVRNIFPYDLWDDCGVLDHLMVVPKRHIDTISHLDDQEQVDYIKLVAEYESQGYSVYSRAPKSSRKSVFHLHTHLIKLDNKPKRFILYNRRPYRLITK